MSRQGYVYVAIDEGRPGHCKVGRAIDVPDRERELNAGKPKATIKIVDSVHVDDMVAVEGAFHSILYYQRDDENGREWFNIEAHRVRPMLMCLAKLALERTPSQSAYAVNNVDKSGSWHKEGWRMHCDGAKEAEIADAFNVTRSAVAAMKKKMRKAGLGGDEKRRQGHRPNLVPRRTSGDRDSREATPQSAFRQPIIDVLKDLGGGGEVKQVLELVEQRMRRQLNRADYERRERSKQVIWSNNARFMRLALKKEGILKSDSPRGWWELV